MMSTCTKLIDGLNQVKELIRFPLAIDHLFPDTYISLKRQKLWQARECSHCTCETLVFGFMYQCLKTSKAN